MLLNHSLAGGVRDSNHIQYDVCSSRLLLSQGADVNLKNREGETPLDCCIYNSKVWVSLKTNKKLTDARRSRDSHREKVLSR